MSRKQLIITPEMLCPIAMIQNLVYSYAFHWDSKDAEACSETFAPDGAMDSRAMGSDRFVGRAVVAERLRGLFARDTSSSAHLTSNVRFTRIDENSVEGTCYTLSKAISAHGFISDYVGMYRDRYSRIEGQWFIQERVVLPLAHDRHFG